MTSATDQPLLVIGTLIVDVEKGKLYTGDDSKTVHIPNAPLRLISILYGKSGQIIPTGELRQLLWGKHQRSDGALLELVRRTRSLLEEVGPGRGDHIANIKGKGYFLMRWPSKAKVPLVNSGADVSTDKTTPPTERAREKVAA